MGHVFEPAVSARATCRGCGRKIAKGEIRFGERQANAFGGGEMTLWLHPRCAALKRPEPFLEALSAGAGAADDLEDATELEAVATFGIAHRRLPRLDGASRAPTSRARCRSCHELIAKEAWRIGIVYFEGYRFEPSGYIHAECAGAYFDTVEILDRIRYFSPELEAAEFEELRALVGK